MASTFAHPWTSYNSLSTTIRAPEQSWYKQYPTQYISSSLHQTTTVICHLKIETQQEKKE